MTSVVTLAQLVRLTVFAAQTPPVTIGLEFQRVPDAVFLAVDGVTLEQRLMVRLVQGGFAVVAARESPDVVLDFVGHVRPQGSSLVIACRCSGSTGKKESVEIGAGQASMMQLEIVQKAVELARSCDVSKKTAPVSPPVPEPPQRFHLTGGAFALGRLTRVDPAVRAEVAWSASPSWAVFLATGYAPSFATDVVVHEAFLHAGPSLTVQLSERWSTVLTAEGGAWLHVALVPGQHVVRVDPSGELGFELWFQVVAVELGIRIALGASTRDRVHVVDGTKVWEASAGRLLLGLALRNH